MCMHFYTIYCSATTQPGTQLIPLWAPCTMKISLPWADWSSAVPLGLLKCSIQPELSILHDLIVSTGRATLRKPPFLYSPLETFKHRDS